MAKPHKTIFFFLFGVIVAVSAGVVLVMDGAADAEPVAAETTPVVVHPEAKDFQLAALDGTSLRFSDHLGDVVVLNFWATWCGPCRYEIPDFIELQEEFADQGLQIIGVSLDEEGFEVVRPFAEEYPFNYPLVVDDSSVAEAYGGIYSLPTTYLIDRQGKIRQRFMTMVSKDMLLPLIKELLAEEGPSHATATP